MKTKINFQTKRFLTNKLLFLCILTGIFLLPNLASATSITSENIIKATNKIRIEKNKKPLTANQILTNAAYKKAKAIFNAQIFSHSLGGKKFSTWIKSAGYHYSYAGENLAINFATTEGTIKAWLNSPTHRRNLLNKNFNEIGVAVVKGKFQNENTTLIVQIFGSPALPLTLNKINYNKLKTPAQNSLTVLYGNNQLKNNYEQILNIIPAQNKTTIPKVAISDFNLSLFAPIKNKNSNIILNNIILLYVYLIFFSTAFLGADYLKNSHLS